MRDVDVNRRLAAWLLTLPGPWEASHLDALTRARHSFHPRMHDTDFHNAIAGLGYALVACAGARFGIEPKGMPLLREPALKRAA